MTKINTNISLQLKLNLIYQRSNIETKFQVDLLI
jgi:hypothetical protein